MTAKGSIRGSDAVWTAKDAAAATGGRARGAWAATGVSIDTRSLKPGDLFIALKGEYGDGHIYVQKALAAGACAAMVSDAGTDAKQPALVVKDTFTALQDLGRAARARTGAKIIAITGSVGKTGTKEMLASAFGALGQTHAAKASHNNHWGVPFSLAGMHAGCDYGIFEIGMNHAGEIIPLTKMVRPHLAIITTVASVHLEHFGTEEKIAEAKAEIFEGVEPGGIAVLNRDNQWFDYLSAKAQVRGLKIFGFGEHADAQARLVDCLEAANGSRIKAHIIDEDVSFTLHIPGGHIARQRALGPACGQVDERRRSQGRSRAGDHPADQGPWPAREHHHRRPGQSGYADRRKLQRLADRDARRLQGSGAGRPGTRRAAHCRAGRYARTWSRRTASAPRTKPCRCRRQA